MTSRARRRAGISPGASNERDLAVRTRDGRTLRAAAAASAAIPPPAWAARTAGPGGDRPARRGPRPRARVVRWHAAPGQPRADPLRARGRARRRDVDAPLPRSNDAFADAVRAGPRGGAHGPPHAWCSRSTRPAGACACGCRACAFSAYPARHGCCRAWSPRRRATGASRATGCTSASRPPCRSWAGWSAIAGTWSCRMRRGRDGARFPRLVGVMARRACNVRAQARQSSIAARPRFPS